MGNKKKQRLKNSSTKTTPDSSEYIPSIKTSTFKDFESSIHTKLSPYKKYLEIIFLVLIIVSGIMFRLDDLNTWKQNRQRAFFNNEPIHTTFDAWFYLSLSKDILEKSYHKIDEKRGIPKSPERPSPPPLISVAAALIAKYTNISLSWVGALLPAILGPLLAIPIFLTGRFFGGPITGLTAALISLLYPYYIHRSNIGRFDTDCMNVIFATSAVYLFLRFGICQNFKRYIYFLFGLIVFILFLWWWDQTPAVVGAITFPPLIIALIFYYRAPKKELITFYSILAIGIVLIVAFTGIDMPLKAFKSIISQFRYISKQTFNEFPNIGITISEQSKPSLEMIVSYTSVNVLSFIFSVSGIILLFIKKTKESLFLVSLIILSILSVTYANRFIIFLIPLLAIGTGYSILTLWSFRKKFIALYLLCPVIFILMLLPLYTANSSYTQWPKENGITVEAMDYVKNNTPDDSILWAWWDHGYAITYWARRATINDGSIHGGERTVYNAIPYATDSYRLSANFMHFYVTHGKDGIRKFYDAVGNSSKGLKKLKEILDAGPANAREIIDSLNLNTSSELESTEDWLEFFFPENTRPVYILVDSLLTKIAYWWFWFGTWDIDKQEGIHPSFNLYYNIKRSNNIISNNSGLKIDSQNGILYSRDIGRYQLSHISQITNNKLNKKEFDINSRLGFEYIESYRFGALCDNNISESVFNKLFIRHSYQKDYFKPIRLRAPYYQIWEVTGDTYKRSKNSN